MLHRCKMILTCDFENYLCTLVYFFVWKIRILHRLAWFENTLLETNMLLKYVRDVENSYALYFAAETKPCIDKFTPLGVNLSTHDKISPGGIKIPQGKNAPLLKFTPR